MRGKTVQKLVLSGIFLAVGYVLPFLTGQLQALGNMLLPMHLPVLMCGLICGAKYGAAVGFVLPLTRSLFFSMPALYPNAVAMSLELATYGFVVGLLFFISKQRNLFAVYRALIVAMPAGRVVWGAVQFVLLLPGGEIFSFSAFVAGAFLNAIPGIVLQLVLIPAVMFLLLRARIDLSREGNIPKNHDKMKFQKEQKGFVMPEQYKTHIQNECFGAERALYGAVGVRLTDCAFDGEEDGESALKEARNIAVENTFCNLRYPFWHDERLVLRNCELTPLCRAALWYSSEIAIEGTKLHGIKALRECRKVSMRDCDIISPEFGWFTEGLSMERCRAEGEYFLLRVKDLVLRDSVLHGKYSFQYVSGGLIENCELNTKDAFWHAKDLTVKNSVVRGEYLGWYAENLTLIDCKIIGTQPLCYCKNLRLENCEMIDADLCFERSEVYATLTNAPVSIKNPRAGSISIPASTTVIQDDPDAAGEVVLV